MMTAHQVAELVGGEHDGREVALPDPVPHHLDFPVAPGHPWLGDASDLPLKITVIRYRHTGDKNPRGAWRYALESGGA